MAEERTTEQEVKELKNKVTKYLEMEKVTELLSKNIIDFDYKTTKYRVSRPSFKQKKEVNDQRVMKYTELLQNPQYLMEKDLIKIYKGRGIDIEEMDNQIKLLQTKKDDLLYKLGEAIKNQAADDDLKLYKSEIKKLINDQQELSLKKIMYLDTSIESQLSVFIYTYYGFLITEKFVEEKWVKAWTDYDTFMSESDDLINLVTFYISFVIKPEVA